MSDGLDRFNSLPADEAENALYSCLANRAWAARVAAGRPYRDFDSLLATANFVASNVTHAEWIEAFAAHPRIGEGGGHSPAASEREQSGVSLAPEDTLAALAAENRLYEERFGHIFLIAAGGRSADEILEALRQRLTSDPATELSVAIAEHRKITEIRLWRLVNP